MKVEKTVLVETSSIQSLDSGESVKILIMSLHAHTSMLVCKQARLNYPYLTGKRGGQTNTETSLLGLCAPGYTGNACATCAKGWGKSGSSKVAI